MKPFLIILFTLSDFLFATCLAQKDPMKIKVKSDKDTIDYFYMNYKNGYHLDKVTLNEIKAEHSCNYDLFFVVGADSNHVTQMNRILSTNYKLNDTLMTFPWYAVNTNYCLMKECTTHHIPYQGKIKLNKKSNVIVMDQQPCLGLKKKAKYKLKVVKFSPYEIIFQDLEKNSGTKLYRFIKNP